MRRNSSSKCERSRYRGALVVGDVADPGGDDAPRRTTWAHLSAEARRSSAVEVGAGGVGTGSYKAGEYNGLQSQGGFVPGTIDFRGGCTEWP